MRSDIVGCACMDLDEPKYMLIGAAPKSGSCKDATSCGTRTDCLAFFEVGIPWPDGVT